MAASGNTLIIGDIVRSVALLDIDWREGKLERKARDHQDLGPYRLAASGDESIICSNVSSPSKSTLIVVRFTRPNSLDSSVAHCSRSNITVQQHYKTTEYSACTNWFRDSSQVPCRKRAKAEC